jgi:hypothetical protein
MQLDEQNRLLTERGMVLVGNEEEDDEVGDDDDRGAAAGDQEQVPILGNNFRNQSYYFEIYNYSASVVVG